MNQDLPKPPKHLTTQAKKLWISIISEYEINDSAGISTLTTACESWDRAKQARETIAADGLVVLDRFGQVRTHPAAVVERDARSQFLLALKQLSLEPDPGKSRGPGSPTWYERMQKKGKG